MQRALRSKSTEVQPTACEASKLDARGISILRGVPYSYHWVVQITNPVHGPVPLEPVSCRDRAVEGETDSITHAPLDRYVLHQLEQYSIFLFPLTYSAYSR